MKNAKIIESIGGRIAAAPGKMLVIYAIILAPVSVLVTSIIANCIQYVFGLETITPNSVGSISRNGIGFGRLLSALIFAPVIENYFCSLWGVWLSNWKTGSWWVKPACIATIAALLHVVATKDIRLFSVASGFFVISTLILNAKEKKYGFWASVIHHFCINAITLLLALMIAFWSRALE